MITDPEQICEIYKTHSLEEYRRRLKGDSDIPLSHVNQIFPFPVHHVRGVYTHHRDCGSGIWFRLIDGSVWDHQGKRLWDIETKDFIESPMTIDRK